MTSVFISYSRRDKLFAEKFTEKLNQSDLETWIDWEDIPASADWLDQIHKGIEGSDGFLFLLSPDSIQSNICRQEVEHAVQNAKRLIPIVVREVDASQVHPALAKVNWIYCREGDDFERAVVKTVEAIHTDLAWVEYHRRLQVRALEWDRRKDPSFLLRGKDLREAEEQLASVGNKDPRPTDLQRQYTLASRRGVSRTRNMFLVIGAVILVALSLLSLFANNQRILAEGNAGTAIANEYAASTEKANAEREKVNADNQRATAVANADLALARQLAAQSQQLAADSGLNMIQSALLAIESLHQYQTVEGDQALKRNLLLFPKLVSFMPLEGEFSIDVTKIAFSPDGNRLASASSNGIARVWDVVSGREVSRMAHQGSVSDLAFSPDGRLVASYAGNTVVVWEALTGKVRARLLHEENVSSFAFSADGISLVSGSAGGAVHVWETLTGREIARMDQVGSVTAVALSPDGRYVVSSSETALHVWEVAAGTELASTEYQGGALKLAFSPDGTYLVAAGPDLAQEWYWQTDEVTARAELSGDIRAVAFDPSWRWVASGGWDGAVVVQVIDGGYEQSRAEHDWFGGFDPVMGAVTALEFSPDGQYVLSGSIDRTARIWHAGTGAEIARMAPGEYYNNYAAEGLPDWSVNTVAFSPDGKLVATGANDGIRLWDFEADLAATSLDLGQYSNYALAFSPDGSKLAYEDAGGLVVRDWDELSGSGSLHELPHRWLIWPGFSADGERVFSGVRDAASQEADIASGRDWMVEITEAGTGREIATIKRQVQLETSANGDWMVSLEGDGSVGVWDTRNGDEIKRLRAGSELYSLAISPDGKRIACASGDALGIWDVTTGVEILHIPYPGGVTSLTFSPDWKWFAAGSFSGIVTVWEAGSGTQVGSFAQDWILTDLAFSPDSRYLASASAELAAGVGVTHSDMILWDTMTQKESARISYDNDIYAIAFSPDGTWVTAYGTGNIARLFDVPTGREVSRITHEDSGSIQALVFSPDGKWVLTAGSAGLLKLWSWRTLNLIADLCSRLPRNLTRAEWNLFLGDQPYRATCPNLPIEAPSTPTPAP